MNNTKSNPNDFVTLTYYHEDGTPAKAYDSASGKTLVPKGLTLREHIAVSAMNGLLANDTWESYEVLSEQSVQIADAMITALNKETP